MSSLEAEERLRITETRAQRSLPALPVFMGTGKDAAREDQGMAGDHGSSSQPAGEKKRGTPSYPGG